MRSLKFVGIISFIALAATTASADLVINPSGVLNSQFNGTDYTDSITLTNLSSSQGNIGTFWFAWIPGENFMPDAPDAGEFVTPTGWVETVTHGGSSDGYAIQWKATSAAADITPGNSLVFGFESVDTPAQISGNSPFYPTTPVGTSYVYPGAPFSDSGHRFIVNTAAVPVPPSFLLGIIGAASMFSARRVMRLRRS